MELEQPVAAAREVEVQVVVGREEGAAEAGCRAVSGAGVAAASGGRTVQAAA
jgi:hypothetical protein